MTRAKTRKAPAFMFVVGLRLVNLTDGKAENFCKTLVSCFLWQQLDNW